MISQITPSVISSLFWRDEFQNISFQNVCRVFFTWNILNIPIIYFYHTSQKIVEYIYIFGTDTNLFILC